MAAKKRASGGGAFGGAKFKDVDGTKEMGKFHKIDSAAKAARLGTKTSSDGFARGGAAKKAGGGGIDEDGLARSPSDADDAGRKRGGSAKKAGGAVAGAKAAPSLAKRARGGRTGNQPFSGATSMTDRAGSANSGHEGE